MNDVPRCLGAADRVQLLCWLTCGCLGAYYLDGAWPGPSFHVQAARKWLERHHRSADWLTTARLASTALRLAQRHREAVESEWAREAVEEIISGEDLNFYSVLVQRIYEDCRVALIPPRLAD
jgi:hypothetical protein